MRSSQELVPELLKIDLLVIKTSGILVQSRTVGGDGLWELTWLHINNIEPSLQSEVFPEQDSEHLQRKQGETGGGWNLIKRFLLLPTKLGTKMKFVLVSNNCGVLAT